MKYTVTGSLGNISKSIVTDLLKAGNEVKVITSSEKRVKEIELLGATAAVGSIADVPFLTKAFTGADAVYTMVPPYFAVSDWKGYIGTMGENYATAIRNSHVKNVVNLSSIGAHMATGCGPVSGLYRVEKAFSTLTGVNIKHLRPAYFYLNLFSNISLINNMGIMGSNFAVDNDKFTIVHPDDIAAVATQALLQPDFTGHSIQYIASDEVSTDQIAKVIGEAIGKPDLKWVQFTDEQATQGAIQAGLPEEMAVNYTEMGNAVQTGEMGEDYWKHRPAKLGNVKLADFAKIFAAVYSGAEQAAAH